MRCARLPETFHGKEGVDGSSPSEGSAKARKTGLLLSDGLARSTAPSFGCTCTIHSVRWVWSTPEKWDSGARVSPETSRGPVCKKLRLLPARVPISMQWLKMPRISPLRRMRRQGHTARVVIGVYSAESTLSRSCLVFRDGGTTARARRASESHTRGRDQPGSVPAELA